MNRIDPAIFRAYDIRGKAHGQLTTEACRLIGQGFGTVLKEKYGIDAPTVALGRDARAHSVELEEATLEGLISAGCSVVRIGETPSPLNYFTICNEHLDGGIQITASHNPKEDNGLKLQLRAAEPYSGGDLQDLRTLIERETFATGKGSQKTMDAVAPYLTFLEEHFGNVGKGKTIVVDTGNGVAGPTYCAALKKIGCNVIGLYTEPDGNFPNHPADPSKHETLRELQAKVRATKADLGFAFDGDGDRLGVVDEAGSIRTSDEVLLLLARDHLSRHPGSPIVFTVSNSGILETEIRTWGGKPILSKVGHSFVEHAMREHRSALGGEQSGHFFCGEDSFGFDDALVAGIRILKSIGSTSITQAMKDFPKVYQAPEFRPHCPDDAKAGVTARITKHFAQRYPVNTLDGARIDFGEGAWAGIRMSNTSPCLSVCMEARSREKLEEIGKIVIEHLKMYPEIEL